MAHEDAADDMAFVEAARGARRKRLLLPFRGLVQAPLEFVDPSPRVLRRLTKGTPMPPLALVSVYRPQFAPHLTRMREQLPKSARVALWALGDIDPELDDVTVGAGPGERLILLNRVLESLDLPPESWVLVSDDDVRFKHGGPTSLVQAALGWELDLSQPVHAWNSKVSYRHNRRRMLMLVRRTSWVEQGPIVLLSPRARARLLPFPEFIRWPGWGVEAFWCREERGGLRLGMVNGVTMVHTLPLDWSRYSLGAARQQYRELLARAGFAPDAELQFDREHWRPWDSMPPAPRAAEIPPTPRT